MTLIAHLAAVADALARLNTVVERDVDGARGFWKVRAAHAPLVIAAGAPYLALSDSWIEMDASPSRWRAHEVACARALAADERAACVLEGGVWVRAIAGRPARAWLADGGVLPALRAAGAALGRAHAHGVTHGDPHLGNILVDDDGAAALIDFETRHRAHLSPAERHGDDVATALLDVVGRGRPADLAPVRAPSSTGTARSWATATPGPPSQSRAPGSCRVPGSPPCCSPRGRRDSRLRPSPRASRR